MTYRNRALLDLARGQPCIACGSQDGTVVPAHANMQTFGKGMGLKASDAAHMHLCNHCHRFLDQDPTMTRTEKRVFQFEMIARTLVRLIEQGKLVVAK